MYKQALIIFVRYPELGKVKTRIAATAGDQKALAIYKQLLLHTRDMAKSVEADRYVYYSESLEENTFSIWDTGDFIPKTQTGSDLGERMQYAFREVLEKGYEKICIIGSDCIDLKSKNLEEAYTMLDIHACVFGPATDGGYYLLGLKEMHPAFFINKQWSSREVLSTTLKDCMRHNLPFFLLEELTDIDTEEDWENYLLKTNQ